MKRRLFVTTDQQAPAASLHVWLPENQTLSTKAHRIKGALSVEGEENRKGQQELNLPLNKFFLAHPITPILA